MRLLDALLRLLARLKPARPRTDGVEPPAPQGEEDENTYPLW